MACRKLWSRKDFGIASGMSENEGFSVKIRRNSLSIKDYWGYERTCTLGK
jgi:hypothetical protein